MKQFLVAWKLREIADLLEILKENNFKIRAFRQAADNLEKLTEDIEKFMNSRSLTEIPGIGKSIASHVKEILFTGNSNYLKNLKNRLSYREILNIPGIGPKLAYKLNTLLGIYTFTELSAALKANKIKELPGMTEQSEKRLFYGLRKLNLSEDKMFLITAFTVGEDLLNKIKKIKGVTQATFTGSLRRNTPVVSGIDILVETIYPSDLFDSIATMNICKEILLKSSEQMIIRTGDGVLVKIIVASPDEYSLVLFLTTEREHAQKIQDLALKQGWSLTDKNWYDGSLNKFYFSSEKVIYEKLGLPYVIPELREGKDGLQAAIRGCLPKVVDLKMIKGDLHLHTRWSDGFNSLEEIVDLARARGYSYVGVCDHFDMPFNNRKIQLIKEQIKSIDDLNSHLVDFTILKGIEVRVLSDGKLNLSEDLLNRIDIIIVSPSPELIEGIDIMNSLLKAMKTNKVDIISLPMGKFIDGFKYPGIDFQKVIEEAKKTDTFIELNVTPFGMNIPEEYIKMCKGMGVMLAINSDAHHLTQFDYVDYGVRIARRCWIEHRDIINTYSLAQLLAFLKKKRKECCTDKKK